MFKFLDVALEFDIDDELDELIQDTVGSQEEYFTSLLAEEFKNAMYEKLLCKGMQGSRNEVLVKWMKEQITDLKNAKEGYMVPNPIRIKE